MNVLIVNKSDNPLPHYETEGAAGLDLRADENMTIPGAHRISVEKHTGDGSILNPRYDNWKLIKTNLFMHIPEGFEAQIRPRSGLALKHGITVLNSPGTIDSDYRGNIGIILINHSMRSFEVKKGDRIAQMVFNKIEQINLSEVEKLEVASRDAKGFGTTGIK